MRTYKSLNTVLNAVGLPAQQRKQLITLEMLLAIVTVATRSNHNFHYAAKARAWPPILLPI
jgi:hypothetical protein